MDDPLNLCNLALFKQPVNFTIALDCQLFWHIILNDVYLTNKNSKFLTILSVDIIC